MRPVDFEKSETHMVNRPAESEFAPFYRGYVSLVPETDILAVLEQQPADLERLATRASPDRERFRYGPDKWSVREVVGHMVDAERVFGYRAFCISRGEHASLPAFDENAYVAQSGFDEVSLADLAREFRFVREGNLAVLRRLDGRGWELVGTANNARVSVRALAFIMAGHVRHHFQVMHARYGVSGASDHA